MFSRAYHMLKSFRSPESLPVPEHEPSYLSKSRDDLSLDKSIVMEKSATSILVDKTDAVSVMQEKLGSIKPRASIRINDNTKSPSKGAMDRERQSSKETEHNRHENVSDCAEEENVADDLIAVYSYKPSIKIEKRSNTSVNLKTEKNKLIEIDDLLEPLVIDIESTDSDDSYHTTPQEVFDLSGSELLVYKFVNEGGQKRKIKINENDYFADSNDSKKCNSDEPDIECVQPLKSPKTVKFSQSSQTLPFHQSHQPSQSALFSTPTSKKILTSPETKVSNNCTPQRVNDEISDVKCATPCKTIPAKANDILIRERLHLHGKKRKKLFTLKLSQLVKQIHVRKHPLHKWRHLITVDNLLALPLSDRQKMIKFMMKFIEVEVYKMRG